MENRTPIIAALSLAVAIAIAAAPAAAQEHPGEAPTAAQQKQLDAARKQLDVAAKQYSELARKYGVERHALDIQRRLLRKPVIGVVLAPDAKAGVRIAGVTPGSAAAEAGLKSGDRLVAVDGKAIIAASPEARVEVARAAIGSHGVASRVQLRYVRGDRETNVVVAPKAGDRLMFIGDESSPEWRLMQEDMTAARAAAAEARAAMPAARRAAADAAHAAADASHAMAEARAAARVAAIAPDVRREIIRLGPEHACRGDNCEFPVIAEALRWNGLNLASVDANLGKYFGTDDGVLVLSTGPGLQGLHAGDVIRSVDGKKVESPRDVMDALRGRKTGSKVAVGYLRDRKAGTAQVTVPEPMQFHIPAPPAPPAPPPPMAMPAPPAPPAPPAID
jgi:membrane-associated protease RseP (regulator of RpoE activity)